MIFVSVGTNEAPFDRLVRAAAELARDEPCVVQVGASTVRPEEAKIVVELTFDDFVDHVRSARLFVTHAGAGSIMVALSEGKRPVVVPRLRALGEAVDDHQVWFARRLAAQGLVTLVEDTAALVKAARHAPMSLERTTTQSSRLSASVLEHVLSGGRPSDNVARLARIRNGKSARSALQSKTRGAGGSGA